MPKFKHQNRMKLRRLYDQEKYVVDIVTKRGIRIAIVPGVVLKNRNFWRKKIAAYPMVSMDHWTRRLNLAFPTNKAKRVEVGLPWRNFEGRRMVTFVEPWSLSPMRRKFRSDLEYAEILRSYYIARY